MFISPRYNEDCIKRIQKENEEKAKTKPTKEEAQDYIPIPLGYYKVKIEKGETKEDLFEEASIKIAGEWIKVNSPITKIKERVKNLQKN